MEPKNVDQLTAALERLVDDHEFRRELGAHGCKGAVRRHSYTKMMAAYLDLYRAEAQIALNSKSALSNRLSTLLGLSRSLRAAF